MINLQTFKHFSECLTITLSAQNPSLKTSMLYAIVKALCAEGKFVSYLDLDLQFSSMIANRKVSETMSQSLATLEVWRARDDRVFDSIVSFLSRREMRNGGVIIIDSVNTLQDLFKDSNSEQDSASANHKASITITLLQQLALHHARSLILSNIVRSRPLIREGEIAWEKVLSGGRMIESKSDIVLSLNELRSVGNEDSKTEGATIVSLADHCSPEFRKGQVIEFDVEPFA